MDRRGLRNILLTVGAGVLLSVVGGKFVNGADEDPPGFSSMFNGKDLSGWEGDLTLWKVEDGLLVGDSPGIKHNQFLATTKSYGDFELRLEFRLRDGVGNSGVQFRSKRVPQSTEVSGYQADIGETYWGGLYDESRRNKVLVKAPDELDKALRKNDWNTYVIRTVGNRVTLTLNGVTTVDYKETDDAIAQSGIIALQVHSGPKLRVEFRNIRIRELKPERSDTVPIESYEQALEYLYCRINYERVASSSFSADDFKLDRMREFLRRLGDPQEAIPVVHVAGTKGKGSTASMIAQALTSSGWRAGLFTSPHITAFEERMTVDGRQPTQGELVELINEVREIVDALDATPGTMSPTYFEIATALAWMYFRRRGVQIGVLEVGLGGRLDATNVCRSLVTVITSISRDHTRQLGNRLEQIAREKAGIIKPGVPLINGATHQSARQAITEVCRQLQSPLRQIGVDFVYGYRPGFLKGLEVPEGADWLGSVVDVVTRGNRWEGLRIPLVGEHQAHNTALAVAALEELREQGWNLPEESVRRGLETLRWPGRIEVVSRRPCVIIDTAHNWAAVRAMLRTLDESFAARKRVLVFAATQDKDVRGLLRQLLPRFDSIVFTSYQNNPRGVPVGELLRMSKSLSERPVHTATDPASAWKLARRLAGPEDLICVTGSFFIAAELRELILGDVSSEVDSSSDRAVQPNRPDVPQARP